MIDVDMTGIQTPEELEDSAPIEDGFYRAEIVAHHQDAKSGALKVVWRIDSPPWAGSLLTETHNLPQYCTQGDKVGGILRKLALFLYRTGQIAKEDMGKRLAFDPARLIGVKRVLHIERRVGKDKPADSRKYSSVAYGCYYTEDRPEIPPAERVRIGLPLLPGTSVPATPPAGTTPAPSRKNATGDGERQLPPALAFDPAEVV